jgi:hypothetical protein
MARASPSRPTPAATAAAWVIVPNTSADRVRPRSESAGKRASARDSTGRTWVGSARNCSTGAMYATAGSRKPGRAMARAATATAESGRSAVMNAPMSAICACGESGSAAAHPLAAAATSDFARAREAATRAGPNACSSARVSTTRSESPSNTSWPCGLATTW